MKKHFLLIVFVLLTAATVFGQKSFLLKDASKNFDLKITVAGCEEGICEGKATVYFLKKNQTSVAQTIQMPNIYLELGADGNPSANLTELYGMSPQ